jgi:hypothetical protein
MFLVTLTFATFPSISFSNDSSTCIGLGGLMLQKNDHIVMMSEDLLLSPSLVRVEYTYLNDSETDQELIVAFALPNIGKMWKTSDSLTNYKEDFKTWVDGKEVKLFDSRDFWNFPNNAGCHKSPEASANEYNLVVRNQIFPSKKLVKVVHQYSPALGSGIPYYGQWSLKDALLEIQRNEDVSSDHLNWFGCTDVKDALTAITKWKKFTKVHAKNLDTEENAWKNLVFYSKLGYILETGQNWKGPIKNFRLKVAAEQPFFLDTCFKGLKRISETAYLFEAEDYVPSENINLTFHFSGMNEINWAPSNQKELLETSIALASVYKLQDLEAVKKLNSLSEEQLRLLRNSVYARHGYKFNSSDLTKYFSQFSWYSPKTKDVKLSFVEQQNIQWIKSLEISQ